METITYSPERREPNLDTGEVIDATTPPLTPTIRSIPPERSTWRCFTELPLRFGEQTDP